jgi:hypothetical protein
MRMVVTPCEPVSADFVLGGVAIAGDRWHELRTRWVKASRIRSRSRAAGASSRLS